MTHGDALDRAAGRYRVCRRFTRHYVASKLRRDPVHADVLALAAREPFGRVGVLGCGYGQLGVALLEAGLAGDVLGLDRRPHAVAEGRLASKGLAYRADTLDLATAAVAFPADTVMLVDVLYQLDRRSAVALLRQALAMARERVLIRTADPTPAFRSRLNRWAERAFRRFWPTAGARVEALPLHRVLSEIERAGFDATTDSCCRGTPFNNVLIVGRARRARVVSTCGTH